MGYWLEKGVLVDWGHGVPNEFFMNRGSLDIWGDYDSVLSQIQLERIPRPVPFGLHDIKRGASEEILKGQADPDTVPLQQFEASSMSGHLHPLQEL